MDRHPSVNVSEANNTDPLLPPLLDLEEDGCELTCDDPVVPPAGPSAVCAQKWVQEQLSLPVFALLSPSLSLSLPRSLSLVCLLLV